VKYEELPVLTRDEVEAALARGDAAEMGVAVLSAALHCPDHAWAESLCHRLASNPEPNVRGNALLGLGHIARIHRSLDLGRAAALIRAGLKDSDPFVRGQADSAADDVRHYVGWPGPSLLRS
jgi:hypothetical protein